MIVLVIISVVFSLIAPNSYALYKKSQVQSEIIKLREFYKKVSYKAFINARSVVVTSKNKTLEYSYQDLPVTKNKVEFDFISFQNQKLIFSESGFSDISSINIYDGNKTIQFNLTNVFSNEQ